jgi:hypothetical protein
VKQTTRGLRIFLKTFMAPLDRILLIGFGVIALAGLACAAACFRFALLAARRPDAELQMFFWAAAGLAGFILACVTSAYILIPIIFGP